MQVVALADEVGIAGERAEQKDLQEQAVGDEVAGQGDDERRQVQSRDQDALDGPERQTEEEPGDYGERPRPVGGGRLDELDGDGGATRTDEADGQVDLAEDEGEGFRHGEHHDHGALLEQVDQVDGRQVHVVGADGLEHGHDDDHRQDDRQDAAIARADARHVSADVFAERLGD